MVSPVHKDKQNLRLDTLLSCDETLSGTSQLMLYNLGDSGGISSRNDRENWSFREVVYIFHVPPAK